MKEQQFEILEHTADLKIKAFGKTKEEIFKNALLGMVYVQKKDVFERKIKNSPPAHTYRQAGGRREKSKVKIKVKINSPDITALLIDFLSEILAQSQINRAVFCDVNFKEFSDTQLEAEIKGVKIKEFDEDIKAATYHGAEVVKKENLYEVIVIYDI